jgi:hypothetical protein
MVDVFAALSLAAAAAKAENPVQLFSDAELLYGAYVKLKAKTTTVDQLTTSGQLKPLVQAAARVTAVANTLVEDPDQAKNLSALLSSI